MIEDHQNAVTDFNEVIKKNPKNAHAHFRRAFSHKMLKNYTQAANDFEKAKILDPLNPKLIVNYKKLKGITCIVLCKPGEETEFV
jgi:Tfp pilus assembly protein PilF